MGSPASAEEDWRGLTWEAAKEMERHLYAQLASLNLLRDKLGLPPLQLRPVRRG